MTGDYNKVNFNNLVKFVNNGQVLTRELLNEKFIETFMFNQSRINQENISDIYLLENSVLDEVSITQSYDQAIKLYKQSIPVLSDEYNINSIQELKNNDINERYKIYKIDESYIYFQQPNETQDLVDKIETSDLSIVIYKGKQSYYNTSVYSSITVESDYSLVNNNFMYFAVYTGTSKVKLYSINITNLGLYLSENNLSFSNIISEITNISTEYAITDVVTYYDEFDLSVSNTIQIDDIMLTILDYNSIDLLSPGTQIYFYVNRHNGIYIIIDDFISNVTHINSADVTDMFKYNNTTYIIHGFLYIYSDEITIQDLNNITITGLNNQTSHIIFPETNTHGFKIIDSTKIIFKDFKASVYNPEGEYLGEQSDINLVYVTQTSDTSKTTDKIYFSNINTTNMQNIVQFDISNISSINPPEVIINNQKLYADVEFITDQEFYNIPIKPSVRMDLSKQSFSNLQIGDGSQQVIDWDQNTDQLEFTTYDESKLKIRFDGKSNTINLKPNKFQSTIHTHDTQDITSTTEITLFAGDLNGIVRKVNPLDGAILWEGADVGTYARGLANDSVGNIYVGNNQGYVSKLSPTNGSLIWTVGNFGTESYGLTCDPDGYVYVGSAGDGIVRKLLPSDGSVIWSSPSLGYRVWALTSDLAGNIYAGSDDGKVRKLNPVNGAIIWTSNFLQSNINSLTCDSVGNIYLGAAYSRVARLNPINGQTVWIHDVSYYNENRGCIACDLDGYVYVAGKITDRKIRKLNPVDGSIIWSSNALTFSIEGITISSEGYIYASGSEKIVKLNSVDGQSIWDKYYAGVSFYRIIAGNRVLGMISIQQGGTNNNIMDITNQYIMYDGTSLYTQYTLQDLADYISQYLNIEVKDELDDTKFIIGQLGDTTLQFQSINSDLSLIYNQQQKKILFNLNVPVKSVNGNIGDIQISYSDVNQQEEIHTHSEYFELTGDTITPTLDTNKQLQVSKSNNTQLFQVNTLNNEILLKTLGNNTVGYYKVNNNKMQIFGVQITETQTAVVFSQQG